jgi:early endosome antigen 1
LINTSFGKIKELSRGNEAIVSNPGAYLIQHVYDDEFVQLINSLSTAIREYFKISRGCFSSVKPTSDNMLDNILNCKSQVNELLLALNVTKHSQTSTITIDKVNLINEKLESLNDMRSGILKNLKVLDQASNKFYDDAKVLFKKMKTTRSSKLEEFNTMVRDIPTNTQANSRRVASTIIEKTSTGFLFNNPSVMGSRIMSKSPPKRHLLTESIDCNNRGMSMRSVSHARLNNEESKKFNDKLNYVKSTGNQIIEEIQSFTKRNNELKKESQVIKRDLDVLNASGSNFFNITSTPSRSTSNYYAGGPRTDVIRQNQEFTNKFLSSTSSQEGYKRGLNSSAALDRSCQKEDIYSPGSAALSCEKRLAEQVLSFVNLIHTLQDSIAKKSPEISTLKKRFELTKIEIVKLAEEVKEKPDHNEKPKSSSSTMKKSGIKKGVPKPKHPEPTCPTDNNLDRGLLSEPTETKAEEEDNNNDKLIITNLKLDIKNLNEQLREFITKNDNLNEELESEKKKVTSLDNKLKEEKTIYNLIEEKLRNEKIKNKELSDKIQGGAISEDASEMEKLRIDNEALILNVDNLSKTIKSLKEQISNLTNEKDKLGNFNSDSNSTVKKLTDDNAKLNTQLTKLKETELKLVQLSDSSDHLINEYEEFRNKTVKEINELNKQVEEKNKQILANENKIKLTQKNFEEAQSIKSKYELTINNIEDEVRQLKDTYTNEKKTLEQKAQTMENRAKEFEQLNRNLIIDKKHLESSNKKLFDKVTELTESNEKMEKELTIYKNISLNESEINDKLNSLETVNNKKTDLINSLITGFNAYLQKVDIEETIDLLKTNLEEEIVFIQEIYFNLNEIYSEKLCSIMAKSDTLRQAYTAEVDTITSILKEKKELVVKTNKLNDCDITEDQGLSELVSAYGDFFCKTIEKFYFDIEMLRTDNKEILSSLESRNTQLSSNLEGLVRIINKYIKSIDIDGEEEKFKICLDGLVNFLDRVDAENSSLKAEVANLQKSLHNNESLNDDIRAVQTELNNKNIECKEYMDSIETLSDKISKLEQEMLTQAGLLDAKQKQIETHININSTLEASIRELHANVEKLNSENNLNKQNYEEVLKSKENEAKLKQQEIEDKYTNEIESIKSVHNEALQELKDKFENEKIELEEIIKERLNNDFEIRIQELKEIIGEKENEIKSLNENIVKLGYEAAQLTAEKDASKNELDDMGKLLIEKENEYKQAQDIILQNHNSELAKLKENVESSIKDSQLYREKYESLLSLNNASQNEKDQLIESKTTEVNDLKNKISKINSEYEELKTTYNNVLEEKANLEASIKEKETSFADKIANYSEKLSSTIAKSESLRQAYSSEANIISSKLREKKDLVVKTYKLNDSDITADQDLPELVLAYNDFFCKAIEKFYFDIELLRSDYKEASSALESTNSQLSANFEYLSKLTNKYIDTVDVPEEEEKFKCYVDSLTKLLEQTSTENTSLKAEVADLEKLLNNSEALKDNMKTIQAELNNKDIECNEYLASIQTLSEKISKLEKEINTQTGLLDEKQKQIDALNDLKETNEFEIKKLKTELQEKIEQVENEKESELEKLKSEHDFEMKEALDIKTREINHIIEEYETTMVKYLNDITRLKSENHQLKTDTSSFDLAKENESLTNDITGLKDKNTDLMIRNNNLALDIGKLEQTHLNEVESLKAKFETLLAVKDGLISNHHTEVESLNNQLKAFKIEKNELENKFHLEKQNYEEILESKENEAKLRQQEIEEKYTNEIEGIKLAHNNALQELRDICEKEKIELEVIIKERLNSGFDIRIQEFKEIIEENESEIKSLNENIIKLRHDAAKLKAEKDAVNHELDENLAKREGDKHTISEYGVKIKLLKEKENEYKQDQESLIQNHNSELDKLKEDFENSIKDLKIYKEKYENLLSLNDTSQNDKDQLIESKITEIKNLENELSKINSEYKGLKTTYNNILEEKASLEMLLKEKETSLANEITNHEKTKQDYNSLKTDSKELKNKISELKSEFSQINQEQQIELERIKEENLSMLNEKKRIEKSLQSLINKMNLLNDNKLPKLLKTYENEDPDNNQITSIIDKEIEDISGTIEKIYHKLNDYIKKDIEIDEEKRNVEKALTDLNKDADSRLKELIEENQRLKEISKEYNSKILEVVQSKMPQLASSLDIRSSAEDYLKTIDLFKTYNEELNNINKVLEEKFLKATNKAKKYKELHKQHLREVNTAMHSNSNLSVNVAYTCEKYRIISDKLYNKLTWVLLTGSDNIELTYDNTHWIPIEQLKNINHFNRYKSDADYVKENKDLILVQEELILKLSKKEEEISKLKTERDNLNKKLKASIAASTTSPNISNQLIQSQNESIPLDSYQKLLNNFIEEQQKLSQATSTLEKFRSENENLRQVIELSI